MIIKDIASDRIKRFRHRFLTETPFISIQRAHLYTEKWSETEASNLDTGIRVALSMKHVFENMTHYVDEDDRIAGYWTENFMGIPIDIERGLFNKVFEIEFSPIKMFFFQLKGNLRFLQYMVKKHGIGEFYQNMKEAQKSGAAMPKLGTNTMDKRKINPYRIKPGDKKKLQKKLLPYWDGQTIADRITNKMKEAGVYVGDMAGFSTALPPTTDRNTTIISTGAALGTWQGHLILDHNTVLKKGTSGIRKEIKTLISTSSNLTQKEKDFLHSIDIALEGIEIYAQRLSQTLKQKMEQEADPQKKAVLSKMYNHCSRVPFYPASTFYEAIQSYWIVKTAVELAIPFNVHAPGRLDQILYPYYRRDIDEQLITREEARELLEELLLKIMSHNMRPYSNFLSDFSQRYEGSEPVTVGGITPEGEDATNELSYLILEAADRSKSALNIVVRLHPKSPEDLYLKIAELHYNGTSSVSIMNDTICLKALKNRGFSEADANDYAITGCVDMVAPGKTGGEGFSALLMSRVLDFTLRNGNSKTLVGTVENIGLQTGEPDSFDSFEDLKQAFIQQSKFMIKKIVQASWVRDKLYADQLPSPFISAFMQGCIQKKKDVTQGGAIYELEGILFMNSLANTIDSLYTIKKLVFDQKKYSLSQILEAVDHNFEGYEAILQDIKKVQGKWGNGNIECDQLMQEITTLLFKETYQYETFKGGKVAPFINSMTSHTYDGRISIATPDGRKAGKPYAPSCSPYHVDKCGPTGIMRSVASIDFQHVLGCAVNIRMHPSAIGKTDVSRKKWISLIKTYFALGGEQLQPTVASTEDLKAAQIHPEQYKNLIVKVGGYSAYFVDLGIEIQNEIISRSEHSMT